MQEDKTNSQMSDQDPPSNNSTENLFEGIVFGGQEPEKQDMFEGIVFGEPDVKKKIRKRFQNPLYQLVLRILQTLM